MKNEKSIINVLGEEYLISGIRDKTPDPKSIRVLPGVESDFSLEANAVQSPLGAVAAAAEFVFRVLGYPRCELSISAFGKNYNIHYDEHGVSFDVHKCKVLFTESVVELHGVDVPCVKISSPIEATFIKLGNLFESDPSVISSFAIKQNAATPVGVYSISEDSVFLRMTKTLYMPHELMLALFSYLSLRVLPHVGIRVNIAERGDICFSLTERGTVRIFSSARIS